MLRICVVPFLALAVTGPLVAEGRSGRAAQISPGVPLSENFDGVTAPALPADWVATSTPDTGPVWVTEGGNPDSVPNAAHLFNPAVAPSDQRLDSPPVSITTSSAQLRFRHSYSFIIDPGTGPVPGDAPVEIIVTTGRLRISMNGGGFQDILAAGGSFVEGGYGDYGAWTGSNAYPPAYSTVAVNLPSSAAGTVVVLSWHMFASVGPNLPGGGSWWIDSIQICDGFPCDANPEPTLLRVDDTGNGVWEPGETVDVTPFFLNNGDATLTLTGAASNLSGPSGATYGIVDPTASYTILPGFLNSCADSGDCYSVTVNNPAARPAVHWDASFRETLDNGLGVTRLLHLGESFPDVPPSTSFYFYIEDIFHNGVTGGCGGGDYCPNANMSRKQMAVFVLKSKFGRSYQPPPCVGAFTDVPCPGPFTDWIEDLHASGIVAGCGPGPAYCPDSPVLRQQMAVFLLKTLLGAAYVPPACEATFPDVPCSNPFAPWIEDLANRQITGGCGGGNYCPANATTRGQMAPFLAKTFGLMLYGP